VPFDPVDFCTKLLNYTPTSYQRELLAALPSGSKRIVLRWARQSGKTQSLASAIIWFCATRPGSLALIVAPGLRQSMILRDKVHALIDRMPKERRRALIRRRLRTTITLRNGSTIVALPNSENLLRGYTANLVVCDEAAFFHNDEAIFTGVLTPMLATTDGAMIVSSTPWGTKTIFHQLNHDPDWQLIHVPWTRALQEGVYKPTFTTEVEKIKATNPQHYRMEYEAEFTEDTDTWLPQDLLAKAVSGDLNYIPFDKRATGDFYAGVDLAERVDHTAIAVLRRSGDTLQLAHTHTFPLGASLASAIGYLKTLHDRWTRIHVVYVDNTKHGDYIITDIHEAGVSEAEGIHFTQQRKQEMAQLLRQRLAEGTLHLPYDRHLLDELNTETYTLTKTGAIALEHPTGTHDDTFWALALATLAAEKNQKQQKPIAIT